MSDGLFALYLLLCANKINLRNLWEEINNN